MSWLIVPNQGVLTQKLATGPISAMVLVAALPLVLVAALPLVLLAALPLVLLASMDSC